MANRVQYTSETTLSSPHLSSNRANPTSVAVDEHFFKERIQKIKNVLLEYNAAPEVLEQMEQIAKIDSLREKWLHMQQLLNSPLSWSPLGYSLLHFASLHFYKKPGEQKPLRTQQMLETLLEAGADIEVKSNKKGDQMTPLHIAGATKNLFAIALLSEKGANLQAKDRFGRTPRIYSPPLTT